MNSLVLRLVTSGLLTVGTFFSVPLTKISFAAPTLELSKSSRPSPSLTPNLSGNSDLLLAQDATEEETNIRVYEKASPAVVSIDTDKTNGSGAIVTPDGLVLTNAHVVSSGGTVTVTLADGRKLEADVIGFGEDGLDLAVLKIRNASNLPTIPIANSGSVKVGQRAFAIGNPFGAFSMRLAIRSDISIAALLVKVIAAICCGLISQVSIR